ncbi:MAG: HD domain-containing phosphohydrolase [Thermodesulfovibrionales bacterium]
MESINILIVDDEPQQCNDMEKILHAIKSEKDYTIKIDKATSDKEALSKFEKFNHDIIFMDIILEGSKLDGIALLKKMYESKSSIEAIVVTALAHDFKHAKEAMRYGGTEFLDKSFNNEDVRRITKKIADRVFIYKEHNRLRDESRDMYKNTVNTLIHALDSRDSYTKYHSENVSELASSILKSAIENKMFRNMALNGDMENNLRSIRHAGLLHDIGKIAIPAKILMKPDLLTKEEKMLMQTHPLVGENILKAIKLQDNEMDIIKYHHAWYKEPLTGSKGYPELPPNKKLSEEVWIIGISDAFDAMTSKRSYKKKSSYINPLKIVYSEHPSVKEKNDIKTQGVQFHPDAIKSFFICDEVLEHIKRKYDQDDFGEKWSKIRGAFNQYRDHLLSFK